MTQFQTNNKAVINLLWTGGWDSTFRILQLSTKEVIIQPHYLVDDTRKSRNFELNVIQTLTNDIRNLASTKCNLRNLVLVNVSDLRENGEVTRAYETIAAEFRLGIQYEWLARYSMSIKDLEIGDENGCAEDSLMLSIINANGALKKIHDENKGDYYVVDPSVSSDDLIKIFGNYHYPILFYNKLMMKKEAEAMGLIDLMNKTWFCHTPVGNQPCGRCAACMGTIKKGLEYRLNKAAHRRYRVKKLIDPVRNSYLYKSMRDFKRLVQATIRQSEKKSPNIVPSSTQIS